MLRLLKYLKIILWDSNLRSIALFAGKYFHRHANKSVNDAYAFHVVPRSLLHYIPSSTIEKAFGTSLKIIVLFWIFICIYVCAYLRSRWASLALLSLPKVACLRFTKVSYYPTHAPLNSCDLNLQLPAGGMKSITTESSMNLQQHPFFVCS